MDREQTIAAIAVMQAFVDGKTIQARPNSWAYGSNGWEDVSDPSWNIAAVEYRISPEPRVIYVGELRSGNISLFWHSDVVELSSNPEISNIRKFIEVLD